MKLYMKTCDEILELVRADCTDPQKLLLDMSVDVQIVAIRGFNAGRIAEIDNQIAETKERIAKAAQPR